MRLAIDFVAVADTQYQYGQESSQKPCSIGIAYLIGLIVWARCPITVRRRLHKPAEIARKSDEGASSMPAPIPLSSAIAQ